MRYIDTHSHTLEHKKGAPFRIRESIESALLKGIDIICFTDHAPLPPEWQDPTQDHDCAMTSEQYKTYKKEVQDVSTPYHQRIDIRKGAEVDWIPSHKEWTTSFLQQESFDYCIGSVHFIGANLIDYTPHMWKQTADDYAGVQHLIKAYYKEVRAMISSGLFDGIGHLDLIKKFNTNEALFSESEPWYKQEVIETLQCIASSPMVMEINTAGWEKPCQDAYPSSWILHLAYDLNIPLTIGSDGHTPETIGQRLSDGIQRAKKAGYRRLCCYKARKREEITL